MCIRTRQLIQIEVLPFLLLPQPITLLRQSEPSRTMPADSECNIKATSRYPDSSHRGYRSRGKFDATRDGCYDQNAGWSSLVARWAHNPKVGGSNPPPATNLK
jgi:hypothetical protein